MNRITRYRCPAYRVKPHLVDLTSIFFLGKLNTPFSATFICLVLPGGNNSLLLPMLDSIKQTQMRNRVP
jgi:hypothetical protein